MGKGGGGKKGALWKRPSPPSKKQAKAGGRDSQLQSGVKVDTMHYNLPSDLGKCADEKGGWKKERQTPPQPYTQRGERGKGLFSPRWGWKKLLNLLSGHWEGKKGGLEYKSSQWF